MKKPTKSTIRCLLGILLIQLSRGEGAIRLCNLDWVDSDYNYKEAKYGKVDYVMTQLVRPKDYAPMTARLVYFVKDQYSGLGNCDDYGKTLRPVHMSRVQILETEWDYDKFGWRWLNVGGTGYRVLTSEFHSLVAGQYTPQSSIDHLLSLCPNRRLQPSDLAGTDHYHSLAGGMEFAWVFGKVNNGNDYPLLALLPKPAYFVSNWNYIIAIDVTLSSTRKLVDYQLHSGVSYSSSPAEKYKVNIELIRSCPSGAALCEHVFLSLNEPANQIIAIDDSGKVAVTQNRQEYGWEGFEKRYYPDLNRYTFQRLKSPRWVLSMDTAGVLQSTLNLVPAGWEGWRIP